MKKETIIKELSLITKNKKFLKLMINNSGDNKKEIIDFTKGTAMTNTCYSHLTILTLEGDYRANVGDWIIKGIKGEFYPCKHHIFKLTYDEVLR